MIKLTPTMGWNSWNTLGTNINEQVIKEIADTMVETGLRDAGYEYLCIDDCWSEKERGTDGRLKEDSEKFPNGMKAVADLCTLKRSEIRHVYFFGAQDVYGRGSQL